MRSWIENLANEIDPILARWEERLHELDNAAAASLRQGWDRFHQRHADFSCRSQRAWTEFRPGLQRGWEEVRAALRRASREFTSRHP